MNIVTTSDLEIVREYKEINKTPIKCFKYCTSNPFPEEFFKSVNSSLLVIIDSNGERFNINNLAKLFSIDENKTEYEKYVEIVKSKESYVLSIILDWGELEVEEGSWIIVHSENEFFPVKDNVFNYLYSPLNIESNTYTKSSKVIAISTNRKEISDIISSINTGENLLNNNSKWNNSPFYDKIKNGDIGFSEGKIILKTSGKPTEYEIDNLVICLDIKNNIWGVDIDSFINKYQRVDDNFSSKPPKKPKRKVISEKIKPNDILSISAEQTKETVEEPVIVQDKLNFNLTTLTKIQ